MKGQGIIEAVFSVGILGLILSGAVVLVLMTTASKKNDFDRKKANELGTLILEEQIDKSKNDKVNFWKLTNVAKTVKTGFEGYNYSVGFTNITNDVNYPNCGVAVTDCAEVVVSVGWSGKYAQTINFNRFFTKYGN